jgi:hypothetical protein
MTVQRSLVTSLFLLCSSFVFAEKKEIPILIDIGLGPATVTWDAPVLSDGQTGYALKFDASAYVESETIKANKDSLPDNLPDWLLDSSISVSPWWIPKTLYLTTGDTGEASVYGVRIAPDLSLGLDLGPFTVRGAAGIDLTYLYLDSPNFSENHFLRPGVHVLYEAAVEPFKYLEISIGQDRQKYWGMDVGAEGRLSSAVETYLKFNIRIPYTVQADL